MSTRSHRFPRVKCRAEWWKIPHISPGLKNLIPLYHTAARGRAGSQVHGLSFGRWSSCMPTAVAGTDLGLLPFPHQQTYVSSSLLLTKMKMSERKASQLAWDLGLLTLCFPGYVSHRWFCLASTSKCILWQCPVLTRSHTTSFHFRCLSSSHVPYIPRLQERTIARD